MLEKPNLPNEQIIHCLREHYGIQAVSVEFLPVGNDATAWVYRVTAAEKERYFLKLKNGKLYPASLAIPRFLRDQGNRQVVAPLWSRSRALWQALGEYRLILYPYIEGRSGMEAGLTGEQWMAFGQALRRIHATSIPETLLKQVHVEDFHPPWAGIIRKLAEHILRGSFHDPYEEQLASYWQGKQAEIRAITAKTEALGASLRATPLKFVLCHSDIHTANLLVEPDGQLSIIDWEFPQMAPIERDLMFVVRSGGPGQPVSREEVRFFEGYGPTQINRTAMAYYRFEWVVQEIGDFGKRVFFSTEGGEETKRASIRGFQQLFDPGDVVEAAYQAQATL